jgi:hypothetical protein
MRQSDESYSSPLQHLLDVWFSPKRFESEALNSDSADSMQPQIA